MKNISILGSTGSIGVNAVDVIWNNPDRFNIVALSACTNVELLRQQMERFKPRVVSVIDERHARNLKKIVDTSIRTEILFGEDGYREVASLQEADMVISAMVGSAGLLPTIEAIEAGKDIAGGQRAQCNLSMYFGPKRKRYKANYSNCVRRPIFPSVKRETCRRKTCRGIKASKLADGAKDYYRFCFPDE